MLCRVAGRLVEHGTRAEAAALLALSAAAAGLAPGAAAALVDWEGSEVARLRAFGVVHGALVHGLEVEDRARLLERLERSNATLARVG